MMVVISSPKAIGVRRSAAPAATGQSFASEAGREVRQGHGRHRPHRMGIGGGIHGSALGWRHSATNMTVGSQCDGKEDFGNRDRGLDRGDGQSEDR